MSFPGFGKSTRRHPACRGVVSFLLPIWLGACSGISIAPSCPDQLAVGASGVVAANVIDPGEIAKYTWEALPADAGTFEDANQPITRFTASTAGEVTIQLTASDGLFQVQSFCRITVGDGNAPPVGGGDIPPADTPIVVSLTANPDAPVADQPVTVTCSSTGETPATSFDIQRVAGLDPEITALGSRSILFTPTEAGTITIQCIGRADDGSEGNPTTLILTVAAGDGGGRR